jgi:hypothetical protein
MQKVADSDFSSLAFACLVSFRIFSNCSKFASVVLRLCYGQNQEVYLTSSSKNAKFNVALSNQTRIERLKSTNYMEMLTPSRSVTCTYLKTLGYVLVRSLS